MSFEDLIGGAKIYDAARLAAIASIAEELGRICPDAARGDIVRHARVVYARALAAGIAGALEGRIL